MKEDSELGDDQEASHEESTANFRWEEGHEAEKLQPSCKVKPHSNTTETTKPSEMTLESSPNVNLVAVEKEVETVGKIQ